MLIARLIGYGLTVLGLALAACGSATAQEIPAQAAPLSLDRIRTCLSGLGAVPNDRSVTSHLMQDAQTEVPRAEPRVAIGLFVGAAFSLVKEFEQTYGDGAGLTAGVDGVFYVTPDAAAVFRYQHFQKSHPTNSAFDWSQNFVNAGIRLHRIGGGVSISQMTGISGTGVYLEAAEGGPGLTWFIKADFVSMNGNQAGLFSLGIGYSFGG